jgi:hypothetical protein
MSDLKDISRRLLYFHSQEWKKEMSNRHLQWPDTPDLPMPLLQSQDDRDNALRRITDDCFQIIINSRDDSIHSY